MKTARAASRHLIHALLGATLLVPASGEAAQEQMSPTCAPARLIPAVGTEPAAKIRVERPLSEPLAARQVVVIHYCAENMRIAPVFGAGALTVSPRVGHVHVKVDDTPWVWADASGNPIILQGLPPGPHAVLIELVDANHQPVDKQLMTFDVPHPR